MSLVNGQSLSAGVRFEGAAIVPVDEHHEGGLGGSGVVEYNPIDFLSIWAGIGYVGISEDHGLIHTADIRNAYMEISDLRTDLGAKLYITNGRFQPYLGLALSYHDFRYTIYHITLDGELLRMGKGSRGGQLGFAPSMGLKAMVSSRWAIDLSTSINLATDYEHFSFKAGLNYLLRH